MISYNNNKIKELYDGKQDVNKTLFVGRPIGQFYLLKSEVRGSQFVRSRRL